MAQAATKKAPAKKTKQDKSSFTDAWTELIRKVLLAGVGTVKLAQDEVEEFIDKAIERGQLAEKDGKSILKEVFDRRKKKANETVDEIQHEVDGKIEKVLQRMSIPSRKDVEALNDKLEELSKKFDDLTKASKAKAASK